jgi:hypothetical protein
LSANRLCKSNMVQFSFCERRIQAVALKRW